jgi:hypothetical protein
LGRWLIRLEAKFSTSRLHSVSDKEKFEIKLPPLKNI